MKVILIFSILFSSSISAKLLDKTLAVMNNNIISLSQVKRIQRTVPARKNISPQVFSKNRYSKKEVVKIIIKSLIVREKLGAMGYVIGDDQVESQVKSTEKRLGLNRKALLRFLKSNNFTFDEYFELIRETIEFNIFISRVIRPLISITDQEIKNTFYKKNINNKTLGFKYTLVDFTLPKSKMKKRMLKKYRAVLKKFQDTGYLPNKYETVETSVLGDISEGGLTKNLRRLLKRTDEGSFSQPILMGNDYHVFFVKKKDLVESEVFLRAKDQIRASLFEKNAKNMTNLWYQREQTKHYIKTFF